MEEKASPRRPSHAAYTTAKAGLGPRARVATAAPAAAAAATQGQGPRAKGPGSRADSYLAATTAVADSQPTISLDLEPLKRAGSAASHRFGTGMLTSPEPISSSQKRILSLSLTLNPSPLPRPQHRNAQQSQALLLSEALLVDQALLRPTAACYRHEPRARLGEAFFHMGLLLGPRPRPHPQPTPTTSTHNHTNTHNPHPQPTPTHTHNPTPTTHTALEPKH